MNMTDAPGLPLRSLKTARLSHIAGHKQQAAASAESELKSVRLLAKESLELNSFSECDIKLSEAISPQRFTEEIRNQKFAILNLRFLLFRPL
jgi:hypothetical protein